ncbi:EamA family transporter RarD [Cognatishimia maritima]|uniref:Chloramphenicol-sensitive protein RarD n=1 Tax=Cognatishimia maritima TaxID=870908 RepID=A0A1M5SWV5_9RHOB|nr:EamA family transporter RarD [Cognatishimia maritima]SHH42880.1 chloramphenicol-sensitive protein RarD [Cognatishimia maritima]
MTQQNQDTPRGLALAITAYVMWGFLPLYMKHLTHVPPVEVVAHRVIWSVPIAGAVLWYLGRTNDLRDAIRNPRMLAMACVTAALVSLNWGIYVYAISIGRTADAALGYYINPLFSMFLATVLLGERPSRAQQVSIALAALAVIVLFVASPAPPWIPLGLTLSWGFYAYCKKSLPIGPNQGFLLEVLILSIPATGYLIYIAAMGDGVFLTNTRDSWILLAAGVVTAVPLMIYANGAKLIRLSTAGILQYIAPSMIFIIAVFLFGEDLDQSRLIAFPMIWTALVIYTISMVRQMRSA